jgi:hypothetical protein
MVFHADGTGTVDNRSFALDIGEGTTSDSSCQFTYVGPDGKLLVKAVPGTFTDTVLTGPIAGLTQLVEVPDASAFIGEGARTIISAASAPIVQQGAKQRRGHGRDPKARGRR